MPKSDMYVPMVRYMVLWMHVSIGVLSLHCSFETLQFKQHTRWLVIKGVPGGLWRPCLWLDRYPWLCHPLAHRLCNVAQTATSLQANNSGFVAELKS